MKQYEIGETFKYNDVTLIVEEKNNCNKCYFRAPDIDCREIECGPLARTDGKSVICRLVNPEEFPEENSAHWDQDLKNKLYCILTDVRDYKIYPSQGVEEILKLYNE